MINAKRIHTILIDCFLKENELIEGKPVVEYIKIEGISNNIGLHKERLLSYKDEISIILDDLPTEFRQGMSTLNMCIDKNNNQWGEQTNVDELCMLAIGCNLGFFCFPRDMWSMLPGGMPYFMIN